MFSMHTWCFWSSFQALGVLDPLGMFFMRVWCSQSALQALGPLSLFRSFHAWSFFKFWSFELDPFFSIIFMLNLPSLFLASGPLSLINLWSCFFLFNLKSSLLLANYCNFCLFWSFLVLHFILSNWSIFFVVVGNFALWLIFFIVTTYFLEVV